MSKDSISEMVMISTLLGKGEIRSRVYKHLSPVTLANIQRALPLSGRINFFDKNFAYILTGVISGEEKPKLEVKRGSVAFMPAGSMLCFFLKDTRSFKPINILGTIDQGIELIESARRGDSLIIDRITAS